MVLRYWRPWRRLIMSLWGLIPYRWRRLWEWGCRFFGGYLYPDSCEVKFIEEAEKK